MGVVYEGKMGEDSYAAAIVLICARGDLTTLESYAHLFRFFTPKIEIPLCGHATLASSKIIFGTTTFESIKFINCNNVELFIEKVEGKKNAISRL